MIVLSPKPVWKTPNAIRWFSIEILSLTDQVHEWRVDAEGGEGPGDDERLHGPPPEADEDVPEVGHLGAAGRLAAVTALHRDFPPQALQKRTERCEL